MRVFRVEAPSALGDLLCKLELTVDYRPRCLLLHIVPETVLMFISAKELNNLKDGTYVTIMVHTTNNTIKESLFKIDALNKKLIGVSTPNELPFNYLVSKEGFFDFKIKESKYSASNCFFNDCVVKNTRTSYAEHTKKEKRKAWLIETDQPLEGSDICCSSGCRINCDSCDYLYE